MLNKLFKDQPFLKQTLQVFCCTAADTHGKWVRVFFEKYTQHTKKQLNIRIPEAKAGTHHVIPTLNLGDALVLLFDQGKFIQLEWVVFRVFLYQCDKCGCVRRLRVHCDRHILKEYFGDMQFNTQSFTSAFF